MATGRHCASGTALPQRGPLSATRGGGRLSAQPGVAIRGVWMYLRSCQSNYSKSVRESGSRLTGYTEPEDGPLPSCQRRPPGPGAAGACHGHLRNVVAALLRLAQACQWATAHQVRCRVSVQTSRAFESESTRSPRTEALAIDWSDIGNGMVIRQCGSSIDTLLARPLLHGLIFDRMHTITVTHLEEHRAPKWPIK